jgi:hypothetical protein
MLRARLVVAVCACLLLAGLGLAADPVPLLTAHGVVEKADKESVTILPRGADGKFAKSITLQLTGTSEIATLSAQSRMGKMVMTQKKTDAKDLQKNQAIAVIYTDEKTPVLLTAVVQPADK